MLTALQIILRRKSMKKIKIKRIVALLLTFAILISVCAVQASALTPVESQMQIYFKPSDSWKKDGARFAVYVFDSNNRKDWFDLELQEENLYTTTIDDITTSTKLIFCRMNGKTTSNNWDNKWNQTGNLDLPTNGNNCFEVLSGWDNPSYKWSYIDIAEDEIIYTPVEPLCIGDADLNGAVNIKDATKIQKSLVGLTALTVKEEISANADENYTIDISDVTEIQKALADLDIETRVFAWDNFQIRPVTNELLNGDFMYYSTNKNTAAYWSNTEGWDYSVTYDEKGGIDNSSCLKIQNNTDWTTRVSQSIELEPNTFYRADCYIKVKNVKYDTYNNEAYLKVSNAFEVGQDYNTSWLYGTQNWTKSTVYFVTGNDGKATVSCSLANVGTAYFDEISVRKIDWDREDTGFQLIEGKYVTTSVPNEIAENITDTQKEKWVNDIDFAYEKYTDLVCGQPIGGSHMYIYVSHEPLILQYLAVAGAPIVYNYNYFYEDIANVGNDMMSFGILHEIGHNFDTVADNLTFHGEVTANYKMVYVLDSLDRTLDKKINIGGGMDAKNIRDYYKASYDNYIANPNGEFNGDGVTYALLRLTDTVGWDTISDAYKWYNENGVPELHTSLGRFTHFLMTVQNCYSLKYPGSRGMEVRNSFPDGELEYIKHTIAYSLDNGNINEDYLLPEAY